MLVMEWMVWRARDGHGVIGFISYLSMFSFLCWVANTSIVSLCVGLHI